MLNTKPIKMWVDGKIFHIQKLSRNNKKIKKKKQETSVETGEIAQQKTGLDVLEIQEDNGKFLTSFRLPKLYYSKLQNLPNLSIEQISQDTKTKIFLPKQGKDGELSIHSDDTNSLRNAVSHIHSAIGEIRERNVPLQFVCIPCLNENVKKSFKNFKEELLSMQTEIDGLHESIFMCPQKLHITVDVYVLLDDREKAEAIKALNDYKNTLEQSLEKIGTKLHIAGLECMNENIKKVDVLYAKIKMANETEEQNLQKIVNDISSHFYHRGLAKRYQENVKLHMTVINTKYRKNTESPKRKRRQSIDATKILEKFKDYNFGECDFDSLHLSHISVKGHNGFYKPLAVIKLEPNKELK